MKPAEIARAYDTIADWWDQQQKSMSSGLNYLERAISICTHKRSALDVGCGSGGRMIAAFRRAGFEVTGIDVSQAMIELARKRHPDCTFVRADICEWKSADRYDLILAWDSIFHVPQTSQRSVVEKLCDALNPDGVLVFTGGGVEGEITGEMRGLTFYYSSLSDREDLAILAERDCRLILMERDQYPSNHLVVIAIKQN